MVAWLAVFRLAALLEYAEHASLWFPPAAVSYAAFRLLAWRGLPAIALACVISALALPGFPNRDWWLAAVLFAAAHSVPYLALGMTIERLTPRFKGRRFPLAVIGFFVLSAIASFFAAFFGLYGIDLAGMVNVSDSLPALLAWWIGDFVGVVSLGPVMIALVQLGATRLRLPLRAIRFGGSDEPALPFLARLATALFIIVATTLVAGRHPSLEPVPFLVYFAVLPLMWIVYADGERRMLLAVAALSIAIPLSLRLFGRVEHALVYQFAMIVMASSAYFGATVPALWADNRALRSMAMYDELTGAVTRRFFLANAQELLRIDAPVHIAIFDLDRFKDVNDTLGHAAGDSVLQRVVAACQGHLRDDEFIGRLGGDEFCVVLRRDESDVVETLHGEIARLAAGGEGPVSALGASFGVVTPEAGETLDEAMARADRALYRAKNAGRNRIEVG